MPTPLYSEEAEVQLLGAAMLNLEAAHHLMASVLAEDFYVPRHRLLFESMRRVWDEGGIPDAPSITADLEAHGLLPRAGGKPGVFGVMANAGITFNAERYAGTVLELAGRRRVDSGLDALRKANRDLSQPLTAILGDIAQLAASVPLGAGSASPGVDALRLDASDRPEDWVLRGILSKEERVIITAPEGYGKSTLLRQLAVQAACGLHPWNLSREPRQRVLLIDVENSQGQLARGLRPLLISAKQASAELEAGYLLCENRLDGLDLCGRVDSHWLLSKVAASQPELLLLGPLYKLHGDEDSTEERVARKVAHVLDEVRARHGCAILIEAHSPYASESGRRTGRPYGASLWSRWPEQGLALAPHKDDESVCDLRRWRGDREVRSWPPELRRGGRWLWNARL